jgi:hypothetical protein
MKLKKKSIKKKDKKPESTQVNLTNLDYEIKITQ